MKLNAAASIFAATLAAAGMALAGDASKPLPPFYPQSPAPAPYEPGKFTSKADAAIELPTGKAAEKDFSTAATLNGEWKFSGIEGSAAPFPADADLSKGYEKQSFDDSKWDSITVPLDIYRKPKPGQKAPGSLRFWSNADEKAPYAKCWYRRTLEIPSGAAGRRVVLHFGVVGYEALLFVNGKEAGRHHGDFTPWDVDVTGLAEPGKAATLAIRVFSDLGPSGACGAGQIIKEARHPYGSQYSKCNVKGGLWRSADMRIVPALRVERAFVTPDLESSSILVDCKLVNETGAERKIELYGVVADALASAPSSSPAPSAKLAELALKPGESSFEIKIPLKNPKLWSPDSPNLYNLVLAVVENGKPVSVKGERFGFRSFKAKDGNFYLNGKRTYLFGESIEVATSFECGDPEQDQPDSNVKGRKAAADVLLGYKSRGSNTLRLSEQPVADAFLDLADETGMMIYDMWAWSYNNKIAPDFEKNDFEEVAEWMRRDYNHPSVVMWLGGNEVHCDDAVKDVFNRQSQLIRSIEKGGRPVSVFSGAAFGYADKYELDTDLIDLHSYLGLGEKPWTFWESNFNNTYAKGPKTCPNGKPQKVPYVIWELVGFSWGQRSATLKPDDVDDYLKWANGVTDWGRPNGIGWAGSIGLAAALDKNRGGRYGMETIGRRIMDYVRQDQRVTGFAPWFCKNSIDLPATSLWTQPVYCGLRDDAGIPLRNVFSGKEYSQKLFVVDSTDKALEGTKARISLVEADGSESVLAEKELEALDAWSKLESQVSFRIPSARETAWAQLRVRILSASGVELSRNFYDIFVQDQAKALAPLEAKGAIGVLSCGATGEAKLLSILDELKASPAIISSPEQLADVKAVIIPPSKKEPKGLSDGSPMAAALSKWLRDGGTLLVLEQAWTGSMPLVSRSYRTMPTVFADIVVGSHPAFKGLSQANFEFWNNPANGQTASVVMTPLSQNFIAARGPFLGSHETFGVLSDGLLGKGRILASQFDACALWGEDSAATSYLRNLIACSLSPAPALIRPWDLSASNYTLSKSAEMVFVDLKPKANMGFKDDVEADGKGGWTDQGENDFRQMPLGRQTLRGVPFEIADPASNGGKSCIALRGAPKGDFVREVKGIKIGERLSRLFLLHGEAYVSAQHGDPALKYIVHYADGQTQEIQCREGVEICDWWSCGDMPRAKLGVSVKNLKGQDVGIVLTEWNNPRPEAVIDALDAIAAPPEATISLLVAVAGEKAPARTLSASDGNWSKLAIDEATGEKFKSGAFVPKADAAMDGTEEVSRIQFPAYSPANPRPVAFTRFKVPAKPEGTPFRYLVAEIKGDSDGFVEFALPDRDWKTAFRSVVQIRKEDGRHIVRIALDGMKFPFEELRGELYIYGGRGKEMNDVEPCSFQLKGLRFE